MTTPCGSLIAVFAASAAARAQLPDMPMPSDTPLILDLPYATPDLRLFEFEIGGYSGITISDPRVNSRAAAKTETAWYMATH